ncbi:HNH endonuclease [Prevotella sp. khp7]|uniref:HNH endonuclease n=1 Tax=Prevotella sp. khp7 TaxID=1761885 RepID=UPI0008ACE616|nr:HNH endonuclease signature motif containing protein [Prevotella sp. khp7]SEV82913.1 HNH endonuclease [Prevotella sp. khp7]
MIIDGRTYKVVDVYDLSVTVPDSYVVPANKTCRGNGEAKLYMGSKDHMREFFTGASEKAGFEVECVIMKDDLLKYMETIKHEYTHPSIKYRGICKKGNMFPLWRSRLDMINKLPSVLKFVVKDQDQIEGNRGYVKTTSSALKGGYGIIRNISLPFVSYISVMKLLDEEKEEYLFYWKLFTDFTQMAEQQYAAKNYGKKIKSKIKGTKRDGQTKYRQDLYALFGHCPFTQIDDAKLLIASHIKPWSISEPKEKIDSNNGLLLSPLYDKLFDRGLISFDNNGMLIVSDWLSTANRKRIDFSYKVEDLHLTPKRQSYLEYHRKYVLK